MGAVVVPVEAAAEVVEAAAEVVEEARIRSRANRRTQLTKQGIATGTHTLLTPRALILERLVPQVAVTRAVTTLMVL